MRTFWLATTLLLIQAASVVHTALMTPKARNADALGLFKSNIERIIEIYANANHLEKWAFYILLIAAMGFSIVALLNQDFRRSHWKRLFSGTSMMVLGSCGSAALYAAAGYGFSKTGDMSKTSVMFTFWTALGLSTMLATRPENARATLVAAATSCALLAANLVGFQNAVRPWMASWAMQREILETIKQQPFALRLEPGDSVLTDVPLDASGVTVFGAPWDIAPAAMVAWADVRPDLIRKPPITIAPVTDLEVAWEPANQNLDTVWGVLPAQRLWLWRWKSGEAVLVPSAATATRKTFDSLFDSLKRHSSS